MTEVDFPKEALLTADEETELARRMEVGTLAAAALALGNGPGTAEELHVLVSEGWAARDRFVLANLRLVAMVAHSAVRRSGLGFADLFQEGVSGLLCAVDRFDYRQGVRFATYALPWIRAQVARVVATRCGAMPLSEHRAERRRALSGVAERLSHDLGRDATAAEVAREVNQGARAVAELLAIEPPLPLVDETGGVIDLPDPGAARAFERIGIRRPAGRDWLSRLPAAERKVVELRFGFNGDPHSFSEIAAVRGVSKSTVRRFEGRAMERLRGECSTEHFLMAG